MSTKVTVQGQPVQSADFERFLQSEGVRKGASPEAASEINLTAGDAMAALERFAGAAVRDAETQARSIGRQSRPHHHDSSGLWRTESKHGHQAARRGCPLTQQDIDSLATPIDLNHLPD